jgi:hypothetical protein
MSATAPASDPNTQPEPSRVGRLLGLVRRLIEYGKQLATTFQQPGADLSFPAVLPFGTRDVRLILARIACGLQRASALEARLLRRAAHLDAGPRPSGTPSPRTPRAAPPAARLAAQADPRLALLPTAEQIAADVRRRPIGVVIADICRDLGIMPGHLDRAFWDELSHAIIAYGGNLTCFLPNLNRLLFALGCGDCADPADPGWCAAPPRLPASATGPP